MERIIVVKYIRKSSVRPEYRDCITDNEDKINELFIIYHFTDVYKNTYNDIISKEIKRILNTHYNNGPRIEHTIDYKYVIDTCYTIYNSACQDDIRYILTEHTDKKAYVIENYYNGNDFENHRAFFVLNTKNVNSYNICTNTREQIYNTKINIYEYFEL